MNFICKGNWRCGIYDDNQYYIFILLYDFLKVLDSNDKFCVSKTLFRNDDATENQFEKL